LRTRLGITSTEILIDRHL